MYVVIVNNRRSQFRRVPFAEAVEQVAQAHRDGKRWDLRRATSGAGYRPLLEDEAVAIVSAVRDRLLTTNDPS